MKLKLLVTDKIIERRREVTAIHAQQWANPRRQINRGSKLTLVIMTMMTTLKLREAFAQRAPRVQAIPMTSLMSFHKGKSTEACE